MTGFGASRPSAPVPRTSLHWSIAVAQAWTPEPPLAPHAPKLTLPERGCNGEVGPVVGIQNQ